MAGEDTGAGRPVCDRGTPVALELRGVCRSFGSVPALRDVTLTLRAGEILVLLGPNGAGKSTLMRLACGALRPGAGSLALFGAISAKARRATRARVGYMPETLVLWDDLSCMEQLVFAGQMYRMRRDRARQRAEALLERLGLQKQGAVLAGRLSGGMKRRLNLALALVHDPTLLLLDEPLTGLDPHHRVQVRQLIVELARSGKSVLLATHEMDEADRMAQRLMVLDGGAVVAEGTPGELRARVAEEGARDVASGPLPLEQIFIQLTSRGEGL